MENHNDVYRSDLGSKLAGNPILRSVSELPHVRLGRFETSNARSFSMSALGDDGDGFDIVRDTGSVCDPLSHKLNIKPDFCLESTVNSLQRLPTVIITKKDPKKGLDMDMDVDLSSPLLKSGDLKVLESPVLISEISPVTTSDRPTPISSSILHPMKNRGLNKSNSIFRETDASAKLPPDSDSSVVSSSELKLATKTKRNKVIPLLVILIFLLVGGLIPSVFFSVRGSSFAVKNYFGSLTEGRRQSLMDSLLSLYGDPAMDDTEEHGVSNNNSFIPQPSSQWDRINNNVDKMGAKLSGYNTFDGINPEYKSDQKMKQLMSMHKNGTVFYGLAYSPRNALEPACGLSKQDVMYDLAVLSTVTTRIRTYGMQCDQASLILDTIQAMGLNMTLSMGVWIGSNDTINSQQMKAMEDVLAKYPTDLFESIFIGNEVLFRQEKTTEELIKYIAKTKSTMAKLNKGSIPVGTSEIGSLVNKKLLDNCDVIGANIHPFFGGGDVKYATNWIYNYLKYQIEPLRTNKNQAKIVITEVGWPYKGGKYLNSKADAASFQAFMNQYICEAYKQDYGWYYFEAFDEPWKSIFYEDGNTWETEWGVFKQDRSMKKSAIFPICP